MRILNLSFVSVLLLSGTTLPAQTPRPVNHNGEVQKAMGLFRQHDDAEAAAMLEQILAATVRENNPI